MKRSVLIVALGNDLMGDDGVGIVAGLTLRGEGLPVEMSVRSGLALLDHIEGTEKVLLIDSQTTGGRPGTVEEFCLTPSAIRSPSPHYLGYGEALTVGRAAGLELPGEIRVLAVERADAAEIGAGLSDAVQEALPELIRRAREIVRGW
jgi:hydrogenase maturation protease